MGLEDRLAGLFEPDTMLPTQYFSRLRKRNTDSGERRLMIAILEDAIDVYRKQCHARDGKGVLLFRDAEEWVESTDRTWLFAFENICDVLGLDAGYIRKGLRQWKERGRAERGRVIMLRTDHQPADAPELKRASGD